MEKSFSRDAKALVCTSVADAGVTFNNMSGTDEDIDLLIETLAYMDHYDIPGKTLRLRINRTLRRFSRVAGRAVV